MPRLTITKSCHVDFVLRVAGDVVEVGSNLASNLISCGYAIPAGETKETATVAAPETAAAKPVRKRPYRR